MSLIEAGTLSGNYSIYIRHRALDSLCRFVDMAIDPSARIALVCDSRVAGLYGDRVRETMAHSRHRIFRFCFPEGETHKNLNVYTRLLSFLARHGFTRSDAILALGGGVCGDLAGFAAATYMRGIACIQVPTTLLACIDSSVGGKTAVNLPEGKNLAGCFYQPSLVVIDPETLNTLSPEIFTDGLGEAVKYAVLTGGSLWNLLQQGPRMAASEAFIEACLRYKTAIVSEDEKDRGPRKLLNLGHSFAHAMERQSGYTLRHGYCVAAGLERIAALSLKKGYIDGNCYEQIRNLLLSCGLPVRPVYPAESLLKIMALDKKVAHGRISLVMIHGIGNCECESVSLDQLSDFLR